MKEFSIKNYAGLCCIFTVGKNMQSKQILLQNTLEIMTFFNVPLNLSPFFGKELLFACSTLYYANLFRMLMSISYNLLALAGHFAVSEIHTVFGPVAEQAKRCTLIRSYFGIRKRVFN